MAPATPHPEPGPALPRCVVLPPPGRDVPASLVQATSRRLVTAVVVADAASAMLQLISAPTAALIIIDPPAQPYLDPLLAAVRRYHPRTRLWAYRPRRDGQRPRLEELELGAGADPTVDSAPGSAGGSAPTRGHGSVPPAHAAGNGVGHAQAPRSPRPAASTDDDTPAQITAEELAMLLGSDATGQTDAPE